MHFVFHGDYDARSGHDWLQAAQNCLMVRYFPLTGGKDQVGSCDRAGDLPRF
jgi:hypothetical protein